MAHLNQQDFSEEAEPTDGEEGTGAGETGEVEYDYQSQAAAEGGSEYDVDDEVSAISLEATSGY
jgi:hypothetical protein